MAETLKPCPCCGGKAVVDRVGYCYSDTGDHAMDAWRVSCRSCGARTAEYRSEGGAVEAWNRRHERTCRVEVSHGSHGPVPRFPGDVWTMHHVCSECGLPIDRDDVYCKHCGARVVGCDGA